MTSVKVAVIFHISAHRGWNITKRIDVKYPELKHGQEAIFPEFCVFSAEVFEPMPKIGRGMAVCLHLVVSSNGTLLDILS